MRCTLQEASVHESPRVSLIRVAYQILLIARIVSTEFPLGAGRKTATPATAKTGPLYCLYYLLRRTLLQGLCEGRVPTRSHVVSDIDRVNLAIVAEHIALLTGVERNILLIDDFLSR